MLALVNVKEPIRYEELLKNSIYSIKQSSSLLTYSTQIFMRKVHIKLDLPYNWYAIRKFGLYFDRLSKQLIMTGQSRTFEVDNDEQSLKIKMDLFKSQIVIPQGDQDVYINIVMKGETAAEWAWNSIKRSGLGLDIVSRAEFDVFDKHYSQTIKPIKELDQPSFALTAGVIAYLMYALFNTNAINEVYWLLIWATFVLGATTLLILWKDRKKVSVPSYKSRMILNSVWLFGVVFYLSLQGFLSMGWLVALVPLAVVFRTLTVGNVRLELQ